MTHSEYVRLTGIFKRWAYATTTVFPQLAKADQGPTIQAVRQEDKKVSDEMDRLVDSYVAENQARTDEGQKPTADLNALVEAMRGFLSATDSPVLLLNVNFDETRKRVREWLDLAEGLFPVLLPPFLRKLRESQDYELAVVGGRITPPYEWNGTIKDLAVWLELLVSEPKTDGNGNPQVAGKKHNWAVADQVFTIGGVPVTARQLADAYKH